MYDQNVATGSRPLSLHETRRVLRTMSSNVPTLRRPAHPIGSCAYRLGSPVAMRLHPHDFFEQKNSRFFCWDIAGLIGLAGSLGSPGFGFASATMTSRCWAIAFCGSGVSHLANAARCRRRRSMWSGPVFVAIAVLGLVYGTSKTSAASWDNLWTAAFFVWGFWFLYDRRRPYRRYRVRR